MSRVRRLVAQYLSGSPVSDAAVLLVSELAANACAHSASGQPGGRFTVRVCGNIRDGVYVEVEDGGSAWDGTLKNSESPHGLYLLQELSTACGTRRGDQGWITWFLLWPGIRPARCRRACRTGCLTGAEQSRSAGWCPRPA